MLYHKTPLIATTILEELGTFLHFFLCHNYMQKNTGGPIYANKSLAK